MKKISLGLLGLFAILMAITFTGCSSKENIENIDAVVKVDTTIEQKRVLVNNDLKSIYFYFDKYELDDKANIVVINNAGIIKSLPNNGLVLQGNTDEWGSDEYNYALGLKRANSVKTKLAQEGITNTSVISFGESKPVCTEKTVSCWSQNRRVDHNLK